MINASKEDNAVAIHVRGGDYLKCDFYNTYGIVCNQGYYEKAISYIEKKIDKPSFYVFTNDVPLTINLFKGKKYIIVNNNNGDNAWKDMAIMSKFHSIIISNSTFSWWAAYLGSDKKMVICPPYLQNNNPTSDIFPKNWIRVDEKMNDSL